MNRRMFLGATASAVASASLRARAANPVRSSGVVGEGSHRYECHHDWARPPEQIVFGLTHGIAVDRKGLVHVLHTSCAESRSKDTVVVFDAQGTFVRSWGAQFEGSA